MTTTVDAPLAGLRVLEFGHVAAGPFAGMLLADMGADVVKVESPRGDDLRRWPPFKQLQDGDEFSFNFASLNRNKRSVVLDLKTPDGLADARELAVCANVVVENFRPGVLNRLGLGFDALSTINPSIIFCSISGYGQAGPSATRGAFDVVIQAESGLMDVTGHSDGPPAKCGVPVADFVAGQYAAYSIVCACLQRTRTSEPVYIDCSMFESLLAISALQTSEYWGSGRTPQRLGSAHPRNAPYQAFDASDKPFVIAAGNDRLWHLVCGAIHRSDLVDHPRYRSQRLRVEHVDELVKTLGEHFRREPARHWIDVFTDLGVPCAPVNTYAEALANAQLERRAFVRELPLADGSTTMTTVMPVQFAGTNVFNITAPPRLGEHTREVVEQWLASPSPSRTTSSI